MYGTENSMENPEKKNTMIFPLQFIVPNFLTQLYASPAPMPPAKPAAVGRNSVKLKEGFTTSIEPKNAMMIAIRGTLLIFSLKMMRLNTMAKNGDILFKIDASERTR